MMRVCLVNPPLGLKKRYGVFRNVANTLPSLGILSLAAVVRKRDHNVTIVEASSWGWTRDVTIDFVKSVNPDYIGITSTTLSLQSAAYLARELRKGRVAKKIILGGPHVSAVPLETMKQFSYFDIGVIGEGEITILELIEALESSEKELDSVKGIIYRKNGTLILTDKRKGILNMDELPFPAWDLLPDFPNHYFPPPFRFNKLPAASIVTSRGCPFECTFCDRSVFGGIRRSFTARYIYDLVRYLNTKFRIREILIEDDTFLMDRNLVSDFCNLLINNKLKLSWSCLGRIESAEPELLALMNKAGCWQIGYGIESGSELILKKIKKNITKDRIVEAVFQTKKRCIRTKGFFIIGSPGETESSLVETIDYARKLWLDDISITFMTPFPGSELYSSIRNFGRLEENWEKMNMLEPVFIPFDLSAYKMKLYFRRFIYRFYLRPRIILSYIIRLLSYPKGFKFYLNGFLTLVKLLFLRKW